MSLILSNTVSIIQICFYITGATVAILTYKSAKKGLLNSVNTEYQKRVMDHLEALSDLLFSEFDPDSDNYWAGPGEGWNVSDMVKMDIERFNRLKEMGGDLRDLKGGYRLPDLGDKLTKIINRVWSDPFIPDDIATYVFDKLSHRRNSMNKIVIEEIDNFRDKLVNDDYGDLKNIDSIVHNKVVKRLYESGSGISQVEAEVHNIRLKIKSYLKSYDPLKKEVQQK